jgi:hypothetical protein
MIRFISRWKYTLSALLLFSAALAVLLAQGRWLTALVLAVFVAWASFQVWKSVR